MKNTPLRMWNVSIGSGREFASPRRNIDTLAHTALEAEKKILKWLRHYEPQLNWRMDDLLAVPRALNVKRGWASLDLPELQDRFDDEEG